MKQKLEMESQRRNEREDELEKVKASMASEKQREMADATKKYEEGCVVSNLL